MQAVADAAAARVADLARRKAELAAKLAGLEAEVVERCEGRWCPVRCGCVRLVVVFGGSCTAADVPPGCKLSREQPCTLPA